MIYKRLFYNWLKKENIYNQFFSNVMTGNRHIINKFNSGKKMFEYIVKILGKNPEGYVGTFVWDATYQGYSFWLKKHSKWYAYLSQWKSTH